MLDFKEFVLSESRPQPPFGWEDRYLQMSPDMAQKLAGEKFMKQGIGVEQAGLMGRAIADYVHNWSMLPGNVSRRVLMVLHNKGVPDDEAMLQSRMAGDIASMRHFADPHELGKLAQAVQNIRKTKGA